MVPNLMCLCEYNVVIIINNQLKVILVWPLALPGNFSNPSLLFLGLVGLSIIKPIPGEPYSEGSAGRGEMEATFSVENAAKYIALFTNWLTKPGS